MHPSPSIVPADRPSRRLSQPLYDKAPFQISGLTRAGFCCFREPDDEMLFDFRKAVLCGLALAARVTPQADLLPDAIFRDYLWGRSIEPGRLRGEWRSPRSYSQHGHQFSLKNVCPSRSLSVSSNDILVSGAATCAPVAGTGIILSGFAARRLETFLANSPFAACFGFKTSPPDFGVTGSRATSSSENALCRGRPDCTDVIDVEGLMFDGAIMVSKLASIITRSGARSAELILMDGRSTSLLPGPVACCGKHQLIAISRRTRALPTNPKYFIKGTGRLRLATTLRPRLLAKS